VQLTVREYDALEQAITRGQRIAVHRRGTEFLVIPERIALRGGRECMESRHPTTGDHLTLWLDELDALELVR
jgi:hypothetical protein